MATHLADVELVAPLAEAVAPIFCTVVAGITGMEDMNKVGKTGGFAKNEQ
jgi:Na+/H+-dicarboxylate symporter